MKKIILSAAIILILFNCSRKEELYFTHLYGWMKYDTTGRNGIILTVRDIYYENTEYWRYRKDTTCFSPDSQPGFFEMDSVCYATSSYQGSQIVAVLVDSTDNPGWPRQYWYLTLSGGMDTVELQLKK